jgi:uncharacterized protein (TIGR02646 family)
VIRIVKGRAPAILRTAGQAARESDSAAHDSDPAGYANGTRQFEFDRAIYAAQAVKKALCRLQHDKCCFCEAKVTHISPGDVEHFRPKKAYRQDPRDPLIRPGYYWLAYEWTNLLLSCESCNRRGKASLFPLIDPAGRATPRGRDVSAERPLFLNPAAEDPAEHIEFRAERACPRNGSLRGRGTIIALQLNRRELRLHRLENLLKLRRLKETRDHLAAAVKRNAAAGRRSTLARRELARLQELDADFERFQLPSAEYAAMARAYLGR